MGLEYQEKMKVEAKEKQKQGWFPGLEKMRKNEGPELRCCEDKGHGAVRLKMGFEQPVRMVGRQLTILCLKNVGPL